MTMSTFSCVAAVAIIGASSAAAAQPKQDAKIGTKTDARPADAKPAAGMPERKPPAELADVAKAVTGTWKCKGQGMDHTMKLIDMTGTLTNKLDVDNWWLHASFASRIGKEGYHFESFTTFDPAAKKWNRVLVESGGAWSTGQSEGMKDSKVDWELSMHTAMGEAMFRDHEDVSDPKVGAKMWGEFSIDKGTTWTKVYDIVCKK
jgi:hypothetical protein